MADFEIIEDVGKAIPKGKDLKKFLPFIIAGAGLGLVVLFMNRNNTTTPQAAVSEDVGSDSDLGGVLSDFSNQVNQSLQANNQEMSYQLSEVAGNLFDVVSQQNEVINQLQSQLNKQITNSSTGVSGGSGAAVYPVTTSAQTATAVETYQSSGSSIYFDGNPNDDVQYYETSKNIEQAVSSGKINTTQAKELKKEVASYGNNGVGYDPKVSAQSEARLKTDSTYKQAELERANLVIENRKAAGLSTKAQEDYIAKISKL